MNQNFRGAGGAGVVSTPIAAPDRSVQSEPRPAIAAFQKETGLSQPPAPDGDLVRKHTLR